MRWLLLLSISLLFSQDNPLTDYKSRSSYRDPLSKDQPDQAMQYWFEITRDPKLGRPTPERLIKIEERIRQGKWRDKRTAQKWVERGPSAVGGRTRAILVDSRDPSGNTLWAGGVSGGLWKCTNFLQEDAVWELIGDGFKSIAISSIVQNPERPEEMYFSTGEGWFNADASLGLGIWKSENGGIDWKLLMSTIDGKFSYTQKLLYQNGHLWAATRHNGLMRSDDGGMTWRKLLGGDIGGAYSDRAADIEVASDGTLFASFGILSSDGIYRSKDGGETWIDLIEEGEGLPQENFERIELAIAPSNPQVAYAIFTDTEEQEAMGIYRTADQGMTWDSMPEPNAYGMDDFTRGQGWYDLIMLVNPEDENDLVVGGVDLHRSRDGGSNWYQISQWYGGNNLPYVHADQHQLITLKGKFSQLVVGNDGGIFLLEENDTLYHPIAKNERYNVTQFYYADLHPQIGSPVVIGGTQDNGTQYFSKEGFGSTIEVTGGDGGYCHIDQDEPQIQISSYTYNTYFTTKDQWATYDRIVVGDDAGRFINPTDYDSEHNVLFGAYNEGYLTVVRGVSENNRVDTVKLGNITGELIDVIKIEDQRPTYFYIGTNKHLVQYHIDYEAPRIEAIKAIDFSSISEDYYRMTSIDVHPLDTNQLLMTFGNYGIRNIWYSKDGGFDWEPVDGNLPNFPVHDILFNPSDPGEVFLATELGVWHTTQLDGDKTTWSLYKSGIGSVRVTKLRYRLGDKTLMAATHGRGIFTTTDEDLPTCSDGLQNGDEIGVDCGGSFCPNCPASPCSTFSDIFQINGPRDCGVPQKIETEITVNGNQSFLIYDVQEGVDYRLEFCEQYGQWPASITLWSIIMEEDSSLYFGEVVDFIEDCALEWTATYNGVYFAVVNNTNGACGEDGVQEDNGTLTIQCDGSATTGRDNSPVWNDQVRLFPNPAQTEISLDIPLSLLESKRIFYQIINKSGQVMQSGPYTSQQPNWILPAHWAKGTYFLNLRDEQGSLLVAKKFIRQ